MSLVNLYGKELVYTTNILSLEVATPCQVGQVPSPLSSQTTLAVAGGCAKTGYQWFGTLTWTCVSLSFDF